MVEPLIEVSWFAVTNNASFYFVVYYLIIRLQFVEKKGYSDWGNLIRPLTMLLQRERIGHQKETIYAEYQRIMDMEIQHWRGVLKGVISIIRILMRRRTWTSFLIMCYLLLENIFMKIRYKINSIQKYRLKILMKQSAIHQNNIVITRKDGHEETSSISRPVRYEANLLEQCFLTF